MCKTSGKAESHCLDHINPSNNLVNVRDQFAYYSLQCLCPNQVSMGAGEGRGPGQGLGPAPPGRDSCLTPSALERAPSGLGPLEAPGQGSKLGLCW